MGTFTLNLNFIGTLVFELQASTERTDGRTDRWSAMLYAAL